MAIGITTQRNPNSEQVLLGSFLDKGLECRAHRHNSSCPLNVLPRLRAYLDHGSNYLVYFELIFASQLTNDNIQGYILALADWIIICVLVWLLTLLYRCAPNGKED